MTYELIDLDSYNLVGSYPSKDVALLAVLETADRNGDADAASLSLAGYNATGAGELIAQGLELVRMARARWQTTNPAAAVA